MHLTSKIGFLIVLASITFSGGCRFLSSSESPQGQTVTAAAPVETAAEAAPTDTAAENPAEATVETLPKPAPLAIVERADIDGAVVARLSNGLTIIVKVRRAAPVVCVQSYVHAGGMYERQWLGAGLSHLVEHLVAQGAVHESQSGQSSKGVQTGGRVREIGGQSNAYTSMDHTCYYICAAAGKTMDCVDLVADWMVRPTITLEDFQREHGVVQRELEMGKDKPSRQFWYAHARNVFRDHPAAVPVIGYPSPLSKITYADVLAYHKLMYVPQNMVFVVVGDVDVEKVLARARRAFAGFESGRMPDLSLPNVEAFSGIRRVTHRYEGLKDIIESVSFQSIPLLHKDLYALDVLAYILAEGRSSRLYCEIYRRQKLVTDISCSSWTPSWGKGIFTIRFRCKPAAADKAEKAILAELRGIVDEGVTEDELDRAKRQKTSDWVHSQQNARSIAGSLASDYMSTGDAMFSKHYAQRIKTVTVEQVHAAAKKYLTFDRMAVTRLVGQLKATSASTNAKAVKRQTKVFTLDSGLRVVLRPIEGQLVSMAYVVKGGVLAETNSTSGLGAMMTALSTRGTRRYQAGEIDEFFARSGGEITAKSGSNSFYWQATVLRDNFDKAMDIFAEVVLKPTFDEKELEILRPSLLSQIKRQDESLFPQANKFFRAKFFAGSHYALSPLGRLDVVSKATARQIRAFHRKNVLTVNTNPAVLSICGDFDPESTAEKIRKLFLLDTVKTPQKQPVSTQTEPPRNFSNTQAPLILKTRTKQAAVIIGSPGMKANNLTDRFAITVLDTIISGYRLPSGWLHTELRGKRLVYVVHALNWAGMEKGTFFTYAICSPEKAPEVVRIIRKNLRRASEYKPTEKEILLAVNTILTAEQLGNQKCSDQALSSALDELYGLGYDFHSRLERYYREVTPADVLRVARKYLSGGNLVTVATPKPEMFK